MLSFYAFDVLAVGGWRGPVGVWRGSTLNKVSVTATTPDDLQLFRSRHGSACHTATSRAITSRASSLSVCPLGHESSVVLPVTTLFLSRDNDAL